MKAVVALCALIVLAPGAAFAGAPGEQFFERLSALCGKTFVGQVAAGDAADEAFRKAELVMTVAHCDARQIRIPFRVGEDRSRTWIITRLDDGRLRLKHDHRHPDGVEDELSRYGGDTVAPGSADLQRFPVDEESKALFTRLNRTVSNTNVWALGLTDSAFTYELSRPNRLFRVAFDLTRPAPSGP
ncbi:hypothetical protein [Caulobacter vibrioides]|uniref:Secreted protein n=2 Tax=Caulobacter vibrioides TaxID=155892 RepID=Q9AB47_CAUVC|nr:hypothetical protein [Caulobacter vibrioides]YP_002515766.1 hypothetical protein CCNA_00391 [Caulobacter vibrioides NA1000]AAK22374.1 hypothetical protein CC_0387 [Caulobacter vibrioides CB15]ACL93858.1 hypothetical protein CCNA_00391 [Caulobacter vibrioides NA1000]ATC27217.1 hypothetical protein CA607_01985 [Caulobacter vibrioides]QXZ52480.1 hypothetical protein KZH45_01990 [Caulobacter vibrioides]